MRGVWCPLASLFFLVLIASTAPAADDEWSKPESPTIQARKRRSILTRASKDTAAEQLRYAGELRDSGRTRRAIRAFDAVVRTWPDSPEAPLAQLAEARLFDQRGKFARAFDEYQYLIDQYAGRSPYLDIVGHQFELADKVRRARHAKILFMPGYTTPEKAIPLYETIARNAPTWDRTPEAQYIVGSIQEESGDYELAISSYETVQILYPRAGHAADAAFHQAECAYRISQSSPNDEAACQEARLALSRFVHDHPDHADIAKAREQLVRIEAREAAFLYEKARFYDKLSKKPEAALTLYRDFVKRYPESDRAPDIRERIAVIESHTGKLPHEDIQKK